MKTFSASPVLSVADTESAVRFYRDTLGFSVEFSYGDYVGLRLDGVVLHVCRPSPGHPAGGGSVYLFCDDVDEYLGSIRARGGTPDVEPGDRAYGMRDFAIKDPDGNRLSFGRDLSSGECAKV